MISVVICTYNRADLLTDVLQTACNQSIVTQEYEVIIIDNNSTDETAAVSLSYATQYTNVRYYVENKQGLSYSRNRGWQEARGEYVAYIDDDCKVPVDWLSAAQLIITEKAPDVMGGPYFAFYNRPKPDWFKDEYGANQPYDYATEVGETPDCLHGGNLFIRRTLLQAVKGFNPELGMVGNNVGYGSETALLHTIRMRFPKTFFYYDPSLFVYHLVRPEKVTWRWLIHSHFVKGCNIYHVFQKHKKSKLGRMILLGKMLWIGLCLLWDATVLAHFRDRNKQPYLQQYLYESSLSYVKHLGQLYKQFQNQ